MLLLPLALAAPGGAGGSGEEVVLAAGPSPDGGTDEVAGGEVETVDLEVATLDIATPADVHADSPSPSTTRRTTTASTRSAASGPARSKVTTTTAEVTPTTKTAAARVAAQAPPPPPPPSPAPPPPAPAPTSGGGGDWDRLAVCESGNTNDPVDPYYGYWQFSAETWRSVGEPGLPNEFTRDRQLAAAKRLQASRGWAPWPDCSRRLGLT